jgi:CRISPR/Cas system-associated endonuclease Cas3-HD
MEHKTPPYLEESSKLLLQALTVRKYERDEQAGILIEDAMAKYPGNGYIKWVKEVFESGTFNEHDYVRLISDTEVQLYDTRYIDKEFELVRDCLEIIR